MINYIRSFFQSKLGIGVTLGFLALIALAFASADVSTTGTFGGLSGTNNVAVVGDQNVTSAELRQSTENAFRQVQSDDPTLSLEQFIADGGLTQVLDTLLDRVAISEFGRVLGLRAGDNLINSEIRMLPAFRGPDGNFSEELYRATIQQQGLSDRIVREDLTDGLIARQVLIPAVFGAKFPDSIVRRYATQLREQREGSIGFVPSEAYAPEGDPSAQQLQAFYRANRSQFIRPERRQARYAVFGASQLGDRIEPTQAEIRQRYQDNADTYRASEQRTFTQLIVPTREAAASFKSRIEGGASIEAIAGEAGLEASEIGPVSRESYAQQANSAVATAVFGAAEGDVADIARSPLGFHVVVIEDVTRTPARSLAEARPEIEEALRAEKQRRGLTDFAEEIESRVNGGESFAQIARALGLEVQTTDQLLASGAVFGGEQDEAAPELVQPLVPTLFQMEEGQPQIAEVEAGETFVLFEAASITPSAAPPLAEVREEAVFLWKLEQGAKAAGQAAERILKRVAGGATLAAAMRAEEAALPPARPISLTREQLMQQQRPNPPVALLFAMAEGSAKRIAAPNDGGFFLVELDDITAGELEADDPIVEQARTGYGNVLSREYGDQMRLAIRNELRVERNDEAVDAVGRQLTGQTAN